MKKYNTMFLNKIERDNKLNEDIYKWRSNRWRPETKLQISKFISKYR